MRRCGEREFHDRLAICSLYEVPNHKLVWWFEQILNTIRFFTLRTYETTPMDENKRSHSLGHHQTMEQSFITITVFNLQQKATFRHLPD